MHACLVPPTRASHPHLPCCHPLPCCAADVISADPSYGLDAIYGTIAAVLGINIYNERLLIVKQEQQRDGRSDRGNK